DVELAGEDHLHDVEGRGVGDAPAGDLGGGEAEALLQVGGLRAAAVHDGDARAAVDQRAQVGSEAGGLGGCDDLAADLDDDRPDRSGGHGQFPTSSSEARSSQPSTRFMFWIACPAPPLMRLSIAEKQVTVRLPSPGAPTAKPTSMKLEPATA